MTRLHSPIDPAKPVYGGRDLMLVENYLSPEGCAEFIEYINRSAGKPAPVGDPKGRGMVGNRQDAAFVADRIDIKTNTRIENLATAICKNIYQKIVGPYYKVTIEWFEVPHLLRYSSGGNYVAHSDSENWDPQTNRWIKGVDRDYSSIIYLNSEFTGGSLALPNLNLRIYPRPGMLVTFPSDHRFLHAAEETLSGQRMAFVTWAAKTDSKRVMKGKPPYIVKLT